MDRTVATPIQPAPVAAPDLAQLKARQRMTWSSGDYAIIGTTLQIVGEDLCEALDLRAGQRVIDVAAGNGNASLAAARRWCHVTATDYVPSLLAGTGARARANRLDLALREADAEALPFPDGAFDAVVSTFGVMFTPNQDGAAAELVRVCAPGGKIGLASWTPEGFVGRLLRTISGYVPPAPGLRSPALWGTRERITELFGAHASSIEARSRYFMFRYRSPEHWLELFRRFYGPMLKAFAALDAPGQSALAGDLLALVDALNRSGDSTMVVPGEYLEVVVTRR
jgi:ubiquinone/menaquinone biosynthesis C-methylase UbiE